MIRFWMFLQRLALYFKLVKSFASFIGYSLTKTKTPVSGACVFYFE